MHRAIIDRWQLEPERGLVTLELTQSRLGFIVSVNNAVETVGLFAMYGSSRFSDDCSCGMEHLYTQCKSIDHYTLLGAMCACAEQCACTWTDSKS